MSIELIKKSIFLLCVIASCSLVSNCTRLTPLAKQANDTSPSTSAPLSSEQTSKAAPIKHFWHKHLLAIDKNDYLLLSPTLQNGYLYLADKKGKLSKLNVQTQKFAWQKNYSASFSSGVAVFDKTLVVGTRDGHLMAVNTETGDKQWIAKATSSIFAKPAISNGLVAIKSHDSKLAIYNAADGHKLWVFDGTSPEISLRGSSAPVMVKDMVIAGFDDGTLRAFRLFDGKLMWQQTIASPKGWSDIQRVVNINANLVISEDKLFAVAFNGDLVAAAINTGEILWSRHIPSHQGLAFAHHLLVVADETGMVWGLNPDNGQTFWRQNQLHSRHLSGPSLFAGLIAIGSRKGALYFLDGKDGRVIQHKTLARAPLIMSPVSEHNLLIATTQDGMVTAFKKT